MSENRRYRTRQQADILACLTESGSAHFTAAEIAAKMRARGSTVGLTTVYRCLDRLVEEGALRKFILDASSAACYQLPEIGEQKQACRQHYHLKCEKCGKLIHAECTEIDRFTAHMRSDHGFVIDHAKTVFYGICASCLGEGKE